jgi:hypothetical protein
MCIHSWSFQNNPWVVSSSMRTINQYPRFSILTQTFKSEMHPRFFIALCIQANQHRTNIAKKQIQFGHAVIKRIKGVLNDNHKGEPSFGEGLSS